MALTAGMIEDMCEEHKVSKEQLICLHRAFGIWDRNGDGDISAKELGAIMRDMGKNPTEEECDDMITEVDFDGDCDGTISFSEYAGMMIRKMREQDTATELSQAFTDMAASNGTSITAADIKTALHAIGDKVSDEEVAAMIREADVAGTGEVDKRAFSQVLQKGTAKWPLEDAPVSASS